MPMPTLSELKSYLPRREVLVCWGILAGVLIWSYAAALGRLAETWTDQPDYGHCWFVPVFAVVLLWVRREMVDPFPGSGSYWGLPFLVLWIVMRWTTAYSFVLLFDSLSLLPLFAGLALFVGGWQALRWSWPAIVFLGFMVPLPGFLSTMLRDPLQLIGTKVSVFIIQTVGIPAVAQGNVIRLAGGDLGVVEACSGLRMLMLFFAVCIGAAFLIRAPLWEKIVIVISAIPIAVFSNIGRITITAILHETVNAELANRVFHDGAGLLMMPFAMVLLFAEMSVMKKMFLTPVEQRPLVMGGSLAGGLLAAGSQATPNQDQPPGGSSPKSAESRDAPSPDAPLPPQRNV